MGLQQRRFSLGVGAANRERGNDPDFVLFARRFLASNLSSSFAATQILMHKAGSQSKVKVGDIDQSLVVLAPEKFSARTHQVLC